MVTKSRININIITGSLFEYTYDKVKNHYKDIFGEGNVKDLI